MTTNPPSPAAIARKVYCAMADAILQNADDNAVDQAGGSIIQSALDSYADKIATVKVNAMIDAIADMALLNHQGTIAQAIRNLKSEP